MAALTLLTMLSACGGGGGGHGYLPPSIPGGNPDQPVVSCIGVTCMTNEGLSNSAKRSELYGDYKASESSKRSKSRISLFASNDADAKDINKAFTEMKKQLVDNPIDEKNAESLRPYLILAGFENYLPTENLEDWIAKRKHMIKRHAEKAYEMYGTEKNVYLDNAKLQLVKGLAKQDSFINFTLDNQKNISGIEIAESDFGAEALTNNLTYNGTNFTGTQIIHTYDYKPKTDRRLYIEISGYDEDEKPDLDFVKEKLLLKLEERQEEVCSGNHSCDKHELVQYEEEIRNDIINLPETVLNDLKVVRKEYEATYTSYAKDLKNGVNGGNLLYSDFGLLKITEKTEGDQMRVFAGGYDNNLIKHPEKIETNMTFSGDAVGGVNYVIRDSEDNIESVDAKELKGKANLKFENGKETLTASFNDWYDVTAVKEKNGTGSISFENGNRITDNRFKFKGINDTFGELGNNGSYKDDGYNKYVNTDFIRENWDKNADGYTGAMNIGYYGKDNKPSEATGYVMYHESHHDDSSVEMQLGVGMQRK